MLCWVLWPVTSFLTGLDLTTIRSSFHITRAGFLLECFQAVLTSTLILFTLFFVSAIWSLISLFLPTFSPLCTYFLSSTPAWLCSSVPFHPLHSFSPSSLSRLWIFQMSTFLGRFTDVKLFIVALNSEIDCLMSTLVLCWFYSSLASWPAVKSKAFLSCMPEVVTLEI